jgi:hypothetical protein
VKPRDPFIAAVAIVGALIAALLALVAAAR